MGATFPFAMAAIKRSNAAESTSSFSYLYLANVLGAMTGAVLPLLFIEEWGLRGTLRIGAGLNASLAVCALLCSSFHDRCTIDRRGDNRASFFAANRKRLGEFFALCHGPDQHGSRTGVDPALAGRFSARSCVRIRRYSLSLPAGHLSRVAMVSLD